MGWPEMAEKSRIFRWFTVAAVTASPARSRPVRRRFAVKFHRRDRLDVAHLLGRRVSPVAAGGVSSGPISHRSQLNKRPNSVSGLESSFLGFLELKEFLGG